MYFRPPTCAVQYFRACRWCTAAVKTGRFDDFAIASAVAFQLAFRGRERDESSGHVEQSSVSCRLTENVGTQIEKFSAAGLFSQRSRQLYRGCSIWRALRHFGSNIRTPIAGTENMCFGVRLAIERSTILWE